jgi:4-hydroxythreonine-4-phosphate dehydrogenase
MNLRPSDSSSQSLSREADRPILITQGDPFGIGPECIVKAWQREQSLRGQVGAEEVPWLVVGDLAVLRRAAACVGGAGVIWAKVSEPADARHLPPGVLGVLEPEGLPQGLAERPWGRVDADGGRAAIVCIERAVQWVRAGQARALVTAPIHKEALAAAGSPFPGHTEMLQALAADRGSVPDVRMMLANEQLKVVLVTIHVALRRAIEMLDTEGIVKTLQIAHDAARRWGIESPRIAVAGLNPHAGEGGLFGDEEIHVIEPAVRQARALGMDVRGPYAPDTVFMRARHAPPKVGEFDLVVAMTHDHGLIPVKYLGVEEGVNVTLGLPFVRTSPDHGTAFDIAGQGLADPSSLLSALRMARRLQGADLRRLSEPLR